MRTKHYPKVIWPNLIPGHTITVHNVWWQYHVTIRLSHASPYGICGGQNGLEVIFFPPVFPSHYHLTNSPNSVTYHRSYSPLDSCMKEYDKVDFVLPNTVRRYTRCTGQVLLQQP
jgi:hypothetical protein